MLKNYLKIALRNLRQHRIHAIITIGGLAVSMSLCLLLMLFIKEQLAYDRFHQHADRIYRVTMTIKTGDGDKSYATSPASISPILLADHPEMEGVVTLKPLTSFANKAGENEKAVSIKGFYATSSFFEVFSFGLAAGNPETVLSEPNRIVLSEEYAIYNDAIGILGLAAGLAILIACLGLLGITAYTVEMRIKEIGIRKLVGAGVLNLVLLLSKDFMRPVVIAIAVATPLAWFLNNLWLAQFATRASLGFGVFGPSIFVLLALAGFAVISQTTSAALANPVSALRHE
ncbi:MAG: ABC transporter permease [bacterium]